MTDKPLTPQQQKLNDIYVAGIQDIDADYAQANALLQQAVRDGNDRAVFNAHEAMKYQQKRRAELDADHRQAIANTFAAEQRVAPRLSPDEQAIARTFVPDNPRHPREIKVGDEIRQIRTQKDAEDLYLDMRAEQQRTRAKGGQWNG